MSWVDIEEATISLRKDWSELITAIDLAGSSETVLISTLGDIPLDFIFTVVKAYIASIHGSSYKKELYAKKYYWGSYQYVGFCVEFGNKQTYELIKKNSYITKTFPNAVNKQKQLLTIIYSKIPTLLEIMQLVSMN